MSRSIVGHAAIPAGIRALGQDIMRRTLTSLLLLSFLAAVPARAQRVSGIVRDSASGAPLPGAVVSALTANGRSASRALTDSAGHYAFEVPAAATLLRVARIGYRPTVAALPDSRAGAAVMDLSVSHLATLLAPVVVNEEGTCFGGDRMTAVALWQQARAGLLSAVVAREAFPAIATVVHYERSIDLVTHQVLHQTMNADAGVTTRPFGAADVAKTLSERGYSEGEGDDQILKAPDAEVLLDDSFAQTHCFSVQSADHEHPGAIGLSFEPTGARAALVDVRGTLWLELGVPALRSLEFRYAGPGFPASGEGAGGTVQFRTMPNGVVFIDEWQVRIPVHEQLTAQRTGSVRGSYLTRDSRKEASRVVQWSETGGMVLSAEWVDNSHWSTPRRPLDGIVLARAGMPLDRVQVTFDGTADSALTDSAGMFSFFPILPGHYLMRVTDTVNAAQVSARSVTREVNVESGVPALLQVDLPDRIALAVAGARAGDAARSGASFTGRVTSLAGGVPLVGVEVWVPGLDQRVRSDSSGAFSLDNLPAGPTLVQVRRLGFAVQRDTVTLVAGRATSRAYALASQATQLDTVRTIAQGQRYISPGLRGFESRRMNAATGSFITDSVLRKHENESLASVMMSRVTGITMANGRGGAQYLVSSRKRCAGPAAGRGPAGRPTECNPPNCYPTTYVDGVLMFKAGDAVGKPFDATSTRVTDYAAIEFYADAATGPVQYNTPGSDCGVLLLWTRE
ncbi:MAG: carboxypeptidase regulatory-like domain-containing protein [bacterium]